MKACNGSIRENVVSGTPRNRLTLGETAILITDFVNAQPATTVGEIVEKFGIDRKSASQYLRRLWLGGFIGKRARGLFQPMTSSPIACEDSGDADDSEHSEDLAETVGSDVVEDIERFEDSRETEDGNYDEIDESEDSEDIDDTELVDRQKVSAGGFVDIDVTEDGSLTEDSEDFEHSEDGDDTGDREDSEDASVSAELTSGLQSVAARKDSRTVCPAGRCPDCGSELGKATGKCLECILERARIGADQAVTAS